MNLRFAIRYIFIAAAVGIVYSTAATNSRSATFNWQGNTITGDWSTVGGTGWDGGPPNSAGDVAQRITAMTGSVDIAITASDVTVGTIKVGNGADLGNFYFEIDPASGRVLNLNNSGSGATIEYNNTNTGTSGQLWFGSAGSVNLQDNLKLNVVPNLTGVTAGGGTLAFDLPITGTGNITINSNQAIPNFSISSSGQVQPAVAFRKANSFIGNVTIEKGALQILTATSLGDSSNAIQLGIAGSDSAALLTTNAIMTVANSITVGPSVGTNTGTLTIGYPSTSNAGAVTYTGNITLNSNLNVISNATSDVQNFNGVISGSGGVIFPADFNNGRTNFRGANTYAGDTVINGQTLVARNGSAIPNGAGKGNVSMTTPGRLELRGNETINGLSGSGIIISGGVSTILTLGDNDANGSFSGAIQAGTGMAVTKIGNGTQTLSGTNTYTGATNVNAGTLLINGTNSGNGAVNVASNATLGGSGSLGSSVVTVDGTLAPGASIESLAAGAVSFGATSTFSYDLDSTALNGDLLKGAGAVTIDPAATLSLVDAVPGSVPLLTKLTLINYSGLLTGAFNGYADDSTFTLGANTWRIDYNDTTGGSNFSGEQTLAKFVTITAVPEPGSLSLLGFGLLALAAINKRRRSFHV